MRPTLCQWAHRLWPRAVLLAMRTRTHFEQGSDAPSPARKRQVTPALFWTGIALTAIGAAATVGFAATGYHAGNKLDDGYNSGSLSLARERELVHRGETMNKLAVGSLVFTIAGVALASIVYGVDASRCGPLSKKRAICQPPRGRHTASQ